MDAAAPWVLVPAKKPALSKTRLAPLLPAGSRAALARRLLARLLGLLAAARERELIAEVVVVSPDPGLLMMASGRGARPLVERRHDLNGALAEAQRYAMAQGAAATLVLPTDLPLLCMADLARIVARGRRAPQVVLAPCSRDGGTNALLQRPAGLIPFAFGGGSARYHAALARERGIPLARVQTPGLDFDLDLPEDWQRLYGRPPTTNR
ncbi:MAG TPA: 2-phospho-L-lactate guanylyltransferase [Ardenticatenaceae bacterium]|nr:2-phospho-L-lactate guanylyltransferase [Ardenticatenaceae bacterium]